MSRHSSGRPERPLRVGVTLHLREGAQSIWENGIFQNCVFLAQLLQQHPWVEQAVLLRDGPGIQAAETMMLDGTGVRMIGLEEAGQWLDVIVEMSAQLDEGWVKAFQSRGGRYVWMRVGNDYVIDIERAMFNKPSGGLTSDKPYDAVWTIPEYRHSCHDYFGLMARAPVQVLPHLWSPHFIERSIAQLPPELSWGYQPARSRWRVGVFEPNVCMVKTSLIPMLACEEAYRAKPGFLEILRVCNALQIKEHPKFLHFARQLDVVNHGLASFEGRYPIVDFMSRHGDAVVSHHWENGQNYLYYELLHGGYPLIHNSEFLGGLGYRYPDFDCQLAGEALLQAFAQHDAELADYKRRAASYLEGLSVDSEDNIRIYGNALLDLYH